MNLFAKFNHNYLQRRWQIDILIVVIITHFIFTFPNVQTPTWLLESEEFSQTDPTHGKLWSSFYNLPNIYYLHERIN